MDGDENGWFFKGAMFVRLCLAVSKIEALAYAAGVCGRGERLLGMCGCWEKS